MATVRSFEAYEDIPGYYRKFWFKGTATLQENGEWRVSIYADHAETQNLIVVSNALEIIMDRYTTWLGMVHMKYASH